MPRTLIVVRCFALIAVTLSLSLPVYAADGVTEEVVTFTTADGVILPAVLLYPEAGLNSHGPAILHLHGGPGGSPIRPNSAARYAATGLAQQGYANLSIETRHATRYSFTRFDEVIEDIRGGVDMLAARGFTDGRPRGVGLAEVDRNTMSLFNLRLNRWFAWDGKSDSLWAQSIHPILDSRELALTPALLRERIAGDAELSAGYARVFGTAAADEAPGLVIVNAAKALAAFQETIVSPRSAFDAFRDAVAAGDRAATAAFSQPAQRGLRLFLGRGQCVLCHFGPNFTNAEFHDIGLPHFPAPGRVDPDVAPEKRHRAPLRCR